MYIFHINKECKLDSSGEVYVHGQMSKHLLHFRLLMHLHLPRHLDHFTVLLSLSHSSSCLPYFYRYNPIVPCTPSGIFGWKVRDTAFHGEVSSLHSGCLILPPEYQAHSFQAEEGSWEESTFCLEHPASGLFVTLPGIVNLFLSSQLLSP